VSERDEKLEAGKIVVQNRFLNWLDNFWYHYKWHTIVIGFFVMVFAICFTQCATTARSDVIVTYAGGYTLSARESEEIGKLLTDFLPLGEDGVGDSAGLNPFPIYTEQVLGEMYTYTDEETGELKKDNYAYSTAKKTNQDRISAFSDFLMTGTSSVWMVGQDVYDTEAEDLARGDTPDGLGLVVHERLVPLAELGVDLTHAYDDYAIRLGDTDFYKHYEIMKLLPADTLLVFSKAMVVGEVADEEIYARHRALFLAIVNYKAN
jgi:hypothetical protein